MYLFNSISMKIEEDDVYGVISVPVPVEGVVQSSSKSVREKLDDGDTYVAEQYQLCGHQGIVNADILFGSESDCKKFYREFFSE